MTALAFDTLKATKALRDAGFEQAQAEAVAVTVGGALIGNVATKGDIKGIKSDLEKTETGLRADMKELRSDLEKTEAALRADMKGMEARIAEQFRDLYKHLWLMGVGIVGAAVALIKFL